MNFFMARKSQALVGTAAQAKINEFLALNADTPVAKA